MRPLLKTVSWDNLDIVWLCVDNERALTLISYSKHLEDYYLVLLVSMDMIGQSLLREKEGEEGRMSRKGMARRSTKPLPSLSSQVVI